MAATNHYGRKNPPTFQMHFPEGIFMLFLGLLKGLKKLTETSKIVN
jgi:hypothetical protein